MARISFSTCSRAWFSPGTDFKDEAKNFHLLARIQFERTGKDLSLRSTQLNDKEAITQAFWSGGVRVHHRRWRRYHD
jgi:hypothetical protein